MNKVEEFIQRATDLESVGDKYGALESLNSAFEALIFDASEYALSKEGLSRDSDTMPKKVELLEHSNNFLSKDLSAAMILNSMGILFLEIEEFDAAYQKFEDSIGLIPDGLTYEDPFENKKIAFEKIQSLNQELSEARDGSID